MSQKMFKIPCEYETIDSEKFEEFVEEADSPYVIYGAGQHGRLVLEFLELRGMGVECFYDGNETRHGELYYGKPVISPQTLYGSHQNNKIIITAYFHLAEIERALLENGINSENIIIPPFKTIRLSIFVPEDTVHDAYKERWELTSSPKLRVYANAPHDPPITVRTLVYNIRESYLRRTIESVLNQSFEDFRYIIINNGSTDDSADTIREYANADNRIEVITRPVNIAQGNNYVSGKNYIDYLKENDRFTTKYICTLDSDDYYDPDFLRTSYDLAEKHNADIVLCASYWYRESYPAYCGLHDVFPIGTANLSDNHQKINILFDHPFMWNVTWGKLMLTTFYFDTWLTNTDVNIAKEVGNLTDIYANMLRWFSSSTIVTCDKVMHRHAARFDSHQRVLTPNFRPVLKRYYLNNMIYGYMQKYDAVNQCNIKKLNDSFIGEIFKIDLPTLEDSQKTNPELVSKFAREILQADIPPNLMGDKRMDEVLERLHKLLERG